MKKVLLMMAFVAGMAISANAEVTFGVRAGVNMSKMEFMDETLDNLIGFHVGAVADIKITDLFYFQPGLMFTTKGGKVEEGGGTLSVTPYYLELPLMLSCRISLTDDLALRINAGPYAAFGVAGKVKADEGDGVDIFGDKDGAWDLKRLDFGVGFGGGLEFKQFYLGVTYDLGLANIAAKDAADAGFKVKNQTLGITLGYNF
jgi:hypothetical protein